jgi:hypothetical protein
MRVIPTKKQWEAWTLPGKASYAGAWIGIVAIFISVLFYVLTRSQSSSTVSIGSIKDNRDTQVNVNSPNSKQIINNARRVKREVTIHKKLRSDYVHLTDITLLQTDGIWDQGESFKLQMQLSSPYMEYRFIQGFPVPMLNVREYSNADKTAFSFETTTSPLKNPIIIEIISEKDLDVMSISVSPLESEP